MGSLEKDVLRLELQVVELIRMVANLNSRLLSIENMEGEKTVFKIFPESRTLSV